MAKKQSKQPARLQEALVLHKYKRTEGLSPCVKYRMGDELNENE